MKKIEFTLTSKHNNKRFLADATWKEHETKKPVIFLVHGFKGFKDWGTFNLIAETFANMGYAVVKPNTAYNGTTMDYPYEISDFEAFANNNFSIELDDIGTAIDWVFSEYCPIPNLDLSKVYLIGHSRGGGSAILKAYEDSRINKVVTWAAIPAVTKLFKEEFLKEWKEKKTAHVINGRTGDKLPMNYQMVENYYENIERLNIGKVVAKLPIPLLIIHGSADETVPLPAAHFLYQQNPESTLLVIPEATHTFGGYHPYMHNELPPHLQRVVQSTANFFRGLEV